MASNPIRMARPFTIHLVSILGKELTNCKNVAFGSSFFAQHIFDFADDAFLVDMEFSREIESLETEFTPDYSRTDIEYARLILTRVANFFSRSILFELEDSCLDNEFLSVVGRTSLEVIHGEFSTNNKISFLKVVKKILKRKGQIQTEALVQDLINQLETGEEHGTDLLQELFAYNANSFERGFIVALHEKILDISDGTQIASENTCDPIKWM